MPGLKHIPTQPWFTAIQGGRFFLSLALLLIFSMGNSQEYTDQFRLVKWDQQKGLSLNFKNSMIEDVNGFMWITSPLGINKFDGGRFQIYHPEISGSAKPNSSYSFSLVEDSSHNLWIGTNKGLLFHDTRADTFGSIFPEIKSYATITTIIPFAASTNQVFCIESANLITAYDTRNFQRKLISSISGDLTLKNSLLMQSAVFDPERNKIWIVKGDQADHQDGLIGIDLTNGKQQYLTWTCLYPELEHHHANRSILLDKKRRRIWINCADGLLWFDLDNNQVNKAPAISNMARKQEFYNTQAFNIDRKGKIWFPTNSHGFFIYHPEEDRLEPLFTDFSKQKEAAEGSMSIYFDRRDMVWMGYTLKKGLNQLIRSESAVYELPAEKLNDQPVTNLTAADNGKILIGTPAGTQVWDTRTRKVENFSTIYNVELKTGERVIGMDTLSQKVWILGHRQDSLRETDLITRKSRSVNFTGNGKFLLNYLVPNLSRPYKNGLLVLLDNHGIYHIRQNQTVAEKLIDLPYHITNISLAGEEYIFIRLHFTARNLCYKRTSTGWSLFPNPIDDIYWSTVYFDEKTATYWVGALLEIYHFDKQFRLIKKYTQADGIEAVDVLTLVSANDSSIWYNDAFGNISRLQPKSGTVTRLSEREGYSGNKFNWQTPFILDRAGAISYSGNYGLLRIEPEKVSNSRSSPAYLKNIRVNGIRHFRNINENQLSKIELPHDHKNLSFETGLIDFNGQQYSRVRYKLEGVNNDWQVTNPGQTIQYNQLMPGEYKFIMQASVSGNYFNGPEKTILISIKPAYWHTNLFRFTAILLAVSLIYYLIRTSVRKKYKSRLENSLRELQLNEMKQKTIDLEQKALALEMKTLRAQMNPHFIFNSLNSINRFILQNNRNEASGYLTKFSKLIRMILQHSQEQLITLENELEALKLYLDLEAIRFDHRFESKISVQSSLDTAEIKIPPMVIQPFAENAIWHGLMHKDSKGRLDIEITAENQDLFITITDDGVGREKAAGLENKSGSNHKSIGMKLTKERIMNLGDDRNEPFLRIADLTNPDGSAAGTEVTIKIPLIDDQSHYR